MSASAFKATYSDWKLVRTRQVVQIVFEVPLADADSAYEILGGMPDSSKERWCGIAAIQEGKSQPKVKRDWRNIGPAQQAGMRCEEPTFAAFLKENHPDDWHEAVADPAECVRLICGVKSRSELETNHKARVIWTQLSNEFDAWKALEHA